MMTMQLSEAAQALKARLFGDDVVFRGVSTDTRTLSEGNLFVALRGPNFDGHNYIEQARRRGAVAAAVSHVAPDSMPQLQVEDTRLALGALATHWRRQFTLPLVAVTGSNGKTTVKEMLAAILRRCGHTLVTRGNLNNDIGVPHTLFGLGREHAYAVLELGANHPGEIAYLTSLVQPTVAVINNAGPAHLEGFGSVAGVARAKGELFDSADSGTTCVINADDEYAALWQALAAPRPVVTFGLTPDADVSASWKGDIDASEIQLQTPQGSARTRIALPGRHNVMNALAATAAALAVGAGLDNIARGLGDVQRVHGRWESRRGFRGARVIDDTYNANPASLTAALALLASSDSETWLVLGNMGELGASSEQLHRDMGEAARRAGVERLFALGELAALAADAFGEGATVFTSVDDLVDALRSIMHSNVTVLVKGSRAMQMERVVDALQDTAPAQRRDS
jgi:UDP-N-acetylmuramoyl-tripeptide--D-alanyl-D-alanine ligase